MKNIVKLIKERYYDNDLHNFIISNLSEKWYRDIPSWKQKKPINITYYHMSLYIEKDIDGTISLKLGNERIRDKEEILEILKRIKTTYEYFGSYKAIGYFDMGNEFKKINK